MSNKYLHHATLAISTVLPHIQAHKSIDVRPSMQIDLCGYKVGITSLRLRTFAASAVDNKISCVECGCKATHFAINSFSGKAKRGLDLFTHLNLFGHVDGKDVLFTQDHILARCLGGSDTAANTQTMCSPCNSRKSLGEQIKYEKKHAVQIAAKIAAKAEARKQMAANLAAKALKQTEKV